MIKNMLTVLMDGIKDANMWIEYADECEDNHKIWFSNHAQQRVEALKEDYDYITREIGLVEKARTGDPIAEALVSHLKYQINDLIDHLNRM